MTGRPSDTQSNENPTRSRLASRLVTFVLVLGWGVHRDCEGAGLERLSYQNPGLVVDLSVGLWAWPLPLDFDDDGDLDLVVSCPDVPSNGTYFFENPGGNAKMPVFRAPVRVGPGYHNIQPSYNDGAVRLLTPGHELVAEGSQRFEKTVSIYPRTNIHGSKVRANEWKLVDYDGDGSLDLIVGVGDWTDYGWDNAFDDQGRWTRGPLHGYVYLLHNQGTSERPNYDRPVQVEAAGKPIDVYGMPTPNLADFDGDGDLDLICGEFLDKFTYFENLGTRTEPRFAEGERLLHHGAPIAMDLQMIVPVALDWDGDGDQDLIVGDEDGRVALVEHTGEIVDGMPHFLPPVYFQQQAGDVSFGALITPFGFDWDGDDDEDLICGNSAGYIGFIENLDGGNPPRWNAPQRLEADGEVIRIQARENGSIQGPCEAKWGYTTLSVADWDHDELPDLIVNSIWGAVVWFRNIGTRQVPRLARSEPIEVQWPGQPPRPSWNWWEPADDQLVTQWRTTPVVTDWTGDGLADLVMLDHEGYLALFERFRQDGRLGLKPGRRVFLGEPSSSFNSLHIPLNMMSGELRLNGENAGRSGRRKLCLADWDGDGRLDLLVNSRSVNLLHQESSKNANEFVFQDLGPLDSRSLAGHTTCPTVVDWDKNRIPDLLIGAEDGYLYYLKNPRSDSPLP